MLSTEKKNESSYGIVTRPWKYFGGGGVWGGKTARLLAHLAKSPIFVKLRYQRFEAGDKNQCCTRHGFPIMKRYYGIRGRYSRWAMQC